MKVTILTAPDCSECRLAKGIVRKLAGKYADLEVEEVNVLEHPSTAAKHNIISVPAILINGRLELAGVPGEEDLAKKLSGCKDEKG
jgi:glutaredoxin